MMSHMAHPKYPNIEELFVEIRTAFTSYDGYLLASTITPAAPASNPGRLYNIVGSSNRDRIQADIRYATLYSNQVPFSKQEANGWLDVYVAYWRTCAEVVVVEEAENRGKYHLSDWGRVYEAWKEVVNALIRGYSNGSFPAWTVPCIFTAGKYLRIFAVKADEQLSKGKGGVSNFSTGMDDIGDALNKNKTLEDAARHTNRFFSLCLSDRAPIEQSRKWGIYGVANLLFKTYFRLNSISLSKNILRSISASTTDLPPLEHFPKSHVATFKYYTGVISFLEEDYAKAQQQLSYALQICPRFSMRNRELILTYLVPCHLLTTRTLPTKALLAPYPRLEKLFVPLCRCIKKGDLKGFNEALENGQEEFVKRRIYLTLERGRDVAMRNLLRKVFIAAGFEDGDGEGSVKVRKTRINVDEFVAALRLGVGPADAEELDKDEVECLLANMIYKNLMKGYIARERGIVVLSKKGDAFPGTGV